MLDYNPIIQSGFCVRACVEEVAVIHSGAVTVDSGLSVVVESGLGVSISGQHVFVESGVFVASGLHVVADIAESGIGVQIQSGAHVQISGQHVFVESGTVVDVLEYGYHVLSGDWRPKAVCDSGEMVICSGLHVVADIAESGMGVQVQSGIHIEEVAVLHSGAVIVDSGLSVVVESGLGVSISGQHVYVESGVWIASGLYVQIQSGVPAALPTILRTRPLFSVNYEATQMISSGAVVYVTLKNQGAIEASGSLIWVGGDDEVNSGKGFPLDKGESIGISIDDVDKIWLWAATSGNQVAYLEQNI